jgi:hypothetical protein
MTMHGNVGAEISTLKCRWIVSNVHRWVTLIHWKHQFFRCDASIRLMIEIIHGKHAHPLLYFIAASSIGSSCSEHWLLNTVLLRLHREVLNQCRFFDCLAKPHSHPPIIEHYPLWIHYQLITNEHMHDCRHTLSTECVNFGMSHTIHRAHERTIPGKRWKVVTCFECIYVISIGASTFWSLSLFVLLDNSNNVEYHQTKKAKNPIHSNRQMKVRLSVDAGIAKTWKSIDPLFAFLFFTCCPRDRCIRFPFSMNIWFFFFKH